MNKKLSRLLMASGLLLAFSCSELDEWYIDAPEEDGGDYVTVTFAVTADGATGSTRAVKDGDDDGDTPSTTTLHHISDGSKATRLVYAVYTPEYDANKNVTGYKLMQEYGTTEPNEANNIGLGQTVLNTEKLLDAAGETITLRLLRGKDYTLAFWAQSPDCNAYTTTDLKEITVNYGAAKNNDELRDAYYAHHTFTAQLGISEKVVLTRAMAQINVGTSGWDYNQEVRFGNRYAYSKFVVKGAYTKMNTLTDDVSDPTDVEFGWNRLPAYVNMEKTLEDMLKHSPVKDGELEDDNATSKAWADFLTTKQDEEEFLFVKLTPKQDDEKNDHRYQLGYTADHYYLKYLTETPGTDVTAVDGIYTEVFKYLSMCYVLAPSTTKTETTTPNTGTETPEEDEEEPGEGGGGEDDSQQANTRAAKEDATDGNDGGDDGKGDDDNAGAGSDDDSQNAVFGGTTLEVMFYLAEAIDADGVGYFLEDPSAKKNDGESAEGDGEDEGDGEEEAEGEDDAPLTRAKADDPDGSDEADEAEGGDTDGKDVVVGGIWTEVSTPIFHLVNVPAQRNWRTNILGGTGSGDDKDETSLFDPRGVCMKVMISPYYDGEHNNIDGDEKGKWKEWPTTDGGTGSHWKDDPESDEGDKSEGDEGEPKA